MDGEAPPSPDRRTRIVEAAIAEFADHGMSGARVDRIAERAGVNKQLLYHYFGDKQGLFDEAIRAMAQRFERVRADLPTDPADRLVSYFDGARRDRDVIRTLMWEALEHPDGVPWVEDERRTAHMRAAVDRLAAEQTAGLVPDDLDPAHLFLSFQALAAHPLAFPQMTRFITGTDPDDARFVQARRRFLGALGRRLLAPGPPR